ncbi:MAG: PHP domain-containing protein [Thermoplasmatota archaeon]|nr:PHP domain-containing protein [Candidatus Thermoplasmatota archaeon]MBU1913708.1 PHP domain-containing protein [Candidatus Thermoplasmatota archaeon]
MEVDLHMHSFYSPDSRSKIEAMVRRASDVGLGAIAITDHDSWEGARAASRVTPPNLLIVPGAELKTDKGDLVALFVEKEIKSYSFEEAVEKIHAQAGIAIVPHPGESRKVTKGAIEIADGYEAFNATLSAKDNQRSVDLASGLNKPGIAVSDAHLVMEIGNGRIQAPDCTSLAELREVVLKNPVITRRVRSNPLIHRTNEAVLFGIKGIWRR